MDYVIAEARQHGIRLLLSLVNNLHAYGGKTQYVKWAWQEGVGLSSSNDSFFFDPSIRSYFKNYVKVRYVYLVLVAQFFYDLRLKNWTEGRQVDGILVFASQGCSLAYVIFNKITLLGLSIKNQVFNKYASI